MWTRCGQHPRRPPPPPLPPTSRSASPPPQVNAELLRRGAKVSVAVFWGRERYVTILWRYLERNLRANGGVVDEVVLITHNRDDATGAEGAKAILADAVRRCGRPSRGCSEPDLLECVCVCRRDRC
jgi:hypothetical protein